MGPVHQFSNNMKFPVAAKGQGGELVLNSTLQSVTMEGEPSKPAWMCTVQADGALQAEWRDSVKNDL